MSSARSWQISNPIRSQSIWIIAITEGMKKGKPIRSLPGQSTGGESHELNVKLAAHKTLLLYNGVKVFIFPDLTAEVLTECSTRSGRDAGRPISAMAFYTLLTSI